jgi:cell filamentation protein
MNDPYCYPGTSVLKNKLGLRDGAALDTAERMLAQERHRQLVAKINSGEKKITLTAKGYQDLHRQIFQDVYLWAGQIRTVDIAKTHMFCRQQFVAAQLAKRFAALKNENFLKNMTAEQFAARAAEHVAELNAIHPFREGNGRTQRLFLKALAHEAGHRLDLTRIAEEPWNHASVDSFVKGSDSMANLILNALMAPTPVSEESPGAESREARMESMRARLDLASATPREGQDRPSTE